MQPLAGRTSNGSPGGLPGTDVASHQVAASLVPPVSDCDERC